MIVVGEAFSGLLRRLLFGLLGIELRTAELDHLGCRRRVGVDLCSDGEDYGRAEVSVLVVFFLPGSWAWKLLELVVLISGNWLESCLCFGNEPCFEANPCSHGSGLGFPFFFEIWC